MKRIATIIITAMFCLGGLEAAHLTVLTGPPGVCDLVLAELAGNDAFRFYERNGIETVLREHRLSEAQLTGVRLLRLFPHAGLLVAVGKERVTVFNARNGCRLASAVLAGGEQEKAVTVRKALELAAGKVEAGEGAFLSVAAVNSVGLSPEFQPLIGEFMLRLETALMELPGIQLLERDQLRLLLAERELSGKIMELQASALLLRFEFRASGAAGNADLTVQVTDSAGTILRQYELPECFGAELTGVILLAARSIPDSGAVEFDSKQEALRCFEEYRRLTRLKRKEEAGAKLAAAVALDPDNIPYRRNYFEFQHSWLYGRLFNLRHMLSQAAGEQREEIFCYIAGNGGALYRNAARAYELCLEQAERFPGQHPCFLEMNPYLHMAGNQEFPGWPRADECVERYIAELLECYPPAGRVSYRYDELCSMLPENARVIKLLYQVHEIQLRQKEAEAPFWLPFGRNLQWYSARYWKEMPEELIAGMTRSTRENVRKFALFAAFMKKLEDASVKPELLREHYAAVKRELMGVAPFVPQLELCQNRFPALSTPPPSVPLSPAQKLAQEYYASGPENTEWLLGAIPALLANRENREIVWLTGKIRDYSLPRAGAGDPEYRKVIEQLIEPHRFRYLQAYRKERHLIRTERFGDDIFLLVWSYKNHRHTLELCKLDIAAGETVSLAELPGSEGTFCVTPEFYLIGVQNAISVFSRETGKLVRRIDSLPAMQQIAVLDGRIYLISSGRESAMISCNLEGGDRKAEFSNSREQPVFELEKQQAFRSTLLVEDRERKRLIFDVNMDNDHPVNGLYAYEPGRGALKQLLPKGEYYADGGAIRFRTHNRWYFYDFSAGTATGFPEGSLAAAAVNYKYRIFYLFPDQVLLVGWEQNRVHTALMTER